MMKTIQFVRYEPAKHMYPLFRHMMAPEEQAMFLTHSVSNSVIEFDTWLTERLKFFYHEFFVLESEEGELIGIAYSYDQHISDGHCKMTIYITHQWRSSGLGAVAGLKFLYYLFRYYSFRRVHCDVYSYNTESQNSLRQCGFEETGRVKDYRFYDGEYHDLLLFSITRQFFCKKWTAYLEMNHMDSF